jgi:hypothetical protein
MKPFSLFIFALTLIIFACNRSDEETRRGGREEEEFIQDYPLVFETPFDLLEEENYTFLFEFPEDIPVFDDDIVLAYLLVDLAPITNDESIPVWEPLPLTLFEAEGLFQYAFTYTMFDVEIFARTNNIELLKPELTNDLYARIVLMPAVFYQAAIQEGVNFDNYQEVARKFKLNDKPFSR